MKIRAPKDPNWAEIVKTTLWNRSYGYSRPFEPTTDHAEEILARAGLMAPAPYMGNFDALEAAIRWFEDWHCLHGVMAKERIPQHWRAA